MNVNENMGFNWQSPGTSYVTTNQLMNPSEQRVVPASSNNAVMFEPNNCEPVEQFYSDDNNSSAATHVYTTTTITAPATSQSTTNCNIINIDHRLHYNMQQRQQQRNPLAPYTQNYPIQASIIQQLPQNGYPAPYLGLQNYFLQNATSSSTTHFNPNEQNHSTHYIG